MIYNFIGMRRTGHHGISHWLCAQTHQNTKVTVNKLYGSSIPESVRPSVYTIEGSDHDELFGEPVEIWNYEDEWLDNAINKDFPTVLVMRSVRNTVASRTKGQRGITDEDYVIYRQQALTVLGDIPNPYETFVFIYYDRWFTDPEYRKQIVAEFNRKVTPATFTDKYFSRLDSKLQSGSSWTHCKHDGNTKEMNVLKRYTQVEMPEIPQDILVLSSRIGEKANET